LFDHSQAYMQTHNTTMTTGHATHFETNNYDGEKKISAASDKMSRVNLSEIFKLIINC